MFKHPNLIYLLSLGIIINVLTFLYLFREELHITASPSFTPSISAEKMNFFYVGVDNPIRVTTPEIVSSKLEVKCPSQFVDIRPLGPGRYSVQPKLAGPVTIKVSNGDEERIFKFRAKWLPDPIASLQGYEEGEISKAILLTKKGIIAIFENIDIDGNCLVHNFQFLYSPKVGTKTVVQNDGGKFSNEILRLIKRTKIGDHLVFSEIQCKCPGDIGKRNIGTISFKIK